VKIQIWRDQVLNEMFRNVDVEIGKKGIVGCKNKEKWPENMKYMIK
jgi:hypothetical protein